jgi:TolB-like protein/tetratricopeptide (TPR) repeat protein
VVNIFLPISGRGTGFKPWDFRKHKIKLLIKIVWFKFDNEINRPSMPSLIAGYEYDIFISYRQKDNKGDRWVSEFVEALKTELESTFKEEISVYFDINPHDGLLETHDVDASLKDKLKCLIFIPIISRTYCDPTSFAWEHEFKVFVEQASKDHFGLKVKLANGNVASRVLPVQIHDLDADDKKLCDAVLGGFIRGIEFIYKEPGVDRPLTVKDNEEKNLNKSSYRNQINKVALALKEILSATKHREQKSEPSQKELSGSSSTLKRNNRMKIFIGSLIALLFIILGILFISKLIKPKEQLEKTIAVLPFRNLTNDTTQLYFCDGFMEEILNNLQKINNFTVRSRTSSDLYRDTKKPITVIGKELNANYLLEGSVGLERNAIKIWIQLIDSKADKHIWSNDYNRELRQVFVLQSEIAKDIAAELKTILSPEEKEVIEKGQTENLEAYDLYLQGRYFWNKRGAKNLRISTEYFEKALTKDPNYALAFSGMADLYYTQTVNNIYKPATEGFAKAEELALKAIGLDKNIAEPHVTLGAIFWNEMKWEEAQKELLVGIKINPNYAEAYYNYAQLLDILRRNKEARIQMDKAIKLSPFQSNYHYWSGRFYYNEGKFNESINELHKMLELNPDSRYEQLFIFYNNFRLGENLKAIEALQEYIRWGVDDTLATKYVEVIREIYDSSGIDGILNWLIEINPKDYLSNVTWYALLGKKDKALDCLEEVSENPPVQFFKINNNYNYNSLRSDPRFQAIILKMGLADYQVPN